MILNIDTSDNKKIKVFIESNNSIILSKNILANRNQSEKLLLLIDKLLIESNLKAKDLKEIRVFNSGSSFTSLRIGVLVANALAYSLGIKVYSYPNKSKYIKKLKKFNVVIPDYQRDPDIAL